MIAHSFVFRRLVLMLLLLVAASTQAAGDKLLFWEVKAGPSTVYLLGSMHLARAGLYPLRADIMQAFERSDGLVVEVDIGGHSELEVQQQVMLRGLYPPELGLADDLSAATLALVRAHIRKAGLPEAMLERMRPGLVAMMLSVHELQKLGLDTDFGVDRYFLERARGRIDITELETVDEQLSLVLDVPEPELFMLQTLDELAQLQAFMGPLEDAWRRGDALRLEQLVLREPLAAHPEYRPLFERMYDRRNALMVERLLPMLRTPGTYFVVVGAGHLLGKEGMVTLLEQRGYTAYRR